MSVSRGIKSYLSIDPSLVLWLPFKGDFNDYSGNSNHGINNGATWVTDKYGKSISFDGTNDSINCGNNPILNLTTALTIEAKIFISSGDAKATSPLVFRYGGNAGYYFSMENDSPYTQIRFTFYDADGGYRGAESVSKIALNNWNHVAVTYKDIVNFYINGKNAGGSATVNKNIKTSTNTLYVGQTADASIFYKGKIIDLKIYKTEKTASEIWDNYQRGL